MKVNTPEYIKDTIKPGTVLAPLPVVMVTCGDMKDSNIITIAWTGIVNSNPPMTYVSLMESRYSHHIIKENQEFVINLTTESLAEATDYCGVKSGKDVDKFEVTGLHKQEADIVRAPLIAESPLSIECKVHESHLYGSHEMFVADIVAVHVAHEFLEESGEYNFEKMGLITYSHGKYYKIDNTPLGKFGFSVMKPKTKKRLNRGKKRG